MNIEINIDRQPVAARSMVVREIGWKEMWQRTNEALLNANQEHGERVNELNQQIKRLRRENAELHGAQNAQEGQGCDKNALNEQSITLIHTEAVVNSVPVQNGNQRDDQTPYHVNEVVSQLMRCIDRVAIPKGYVEFSMSLRDHKVRLEMIYIIQKWLADGNGQAPDFSIPTDSRIDELLKRLDKIAGHYGRPYGLPMAHKGTKQLLIDAVRSWVSGK